MQISNPILSQFIGSTVNREQQANRFPAKPVTIEGQVVDEDEKKKNSRAVAEQDGAKNETSDNFVLENEAQLLIRPVTEPVQANDTSTIQKGLAENSANGNPASLNASAQSSSSEQGFPFGNRRSFNGLAGSTLIIQNYLNNTPEQLNRSSGSSPGFSSGAIDYFV